MTQDGRTAQGTIAEFEAWYAANGGDDVDPAAAAGALADLFTRAGRGGADLHDPTPELLRWLKRDVVRGGVDHDTAMVALSWYLLYLRRHGLWRRSERVVQWCWSVLDVTAPPVGLTTLGPVVDATIAQGLRRRPTEAEFLPVAIDRAYVTPLRMTLDTLGARGRLTRPEMAGILGTDDPLALEVWETGLYQAGLLNLDDDTGVLTPSSSVRDAGGCPPPSSDMLEAVVGGLVRTAVGQSFRDDGDENSLPRGMTLLVALVAATDESYYRADEEGPEQSTQTLVADCVATWMEDEADGAQRVAPLVADVLEMLAVLERFGVLERTALPGGNQALLAPGPFRYHVIRAIADVTGCVGTADERVEWEPVDVPSRLAADAAVDLLVEMEQVPGVWRRLRVLASLSLDALHEAIQRSLGWRDVRHTVFCDAEGTRRFAPRWLLRSLGSEADAAVVDSGAVAVGGVLGASGDEMVYLYGHLGNPWRVRVRTERVMSGIKAPVAQLDGGGDAPPEPTVIGEILRRRAPAGLVVPEELERAWAFMETQRWLGVGETGHEVAAPGPPEARPGVVFDSGLTLQGWFEADSPQAARLLPIATSPDGTRIALWLDDDGATRVVGLGPSGEAFLLAETGSDLLRLMAIGYPEISARVLGRPPESPDAVAGVAVFRDWVRGQGLDVPGYWGSVGDDRFTHWVAWQRVG